MTILRHLFFRIQYKEIAFQLISKNQRNSSKNWLGYKAVYFSFNYFLYINQLTKKYSSAPVDRLEGRTDNNQTVRGFV